MPTAAPIENLLASLGGLLTADATLTAAVGTRIYHAGGAQNATLPLIIYTIVEAPQTEYFGGKLRLDVIFDIDVYAKIEVGSAAATGVGAIEDRIHAVIHEASATPSGYERVLFLVQTRGARVVVEDSLRSTTRVLGFATTS